MMEPWVDTRTGDVLFGEAAVSLRLEEAGPEYVISIGNLLLSHDAGDNALFIEATADDRSDEQRAVFASWERNDYIAYGRWVVSLLGPEASSIQLREFHLKTLGRLGLGPMFNGRFRKEFNSMYDYRAAVGDATGFSQGRFDDWSTADFIAYARNLANKLQRVPKSPDYNEAYKRGHGPNYTIMHRRFGSIGEIHEYLGYPNVRNWNRDDYIAWGVRAVRANPETGITRLVIDALSRRSRGPSTPSVVSHFKSLGSFQQLVEAELERQTAAEAEERAKKHEQYLNMVTTEQLPDWVAELPQSELLRIGGSWLVASKCAPTLSDERKAVIATKPTSQLIPLLRKRDPNLTAGKIEATALQLDVFDDIWPTKDEELRVNLPRKRRSTYQSAATHRRRPSSQKQLTS